jgi:hypothetical protein
MKTSRQLSRLIILAALPFILALTSCVHQWPEPAETDFIFYLDFPDEMPQGPTHDIDTRASGKAED